MKTIRLMDNQIISLTGDEVQAMMPYLGFTKYTFGKLNPGAVGDTVGNYLLMLSQDIYHLVTGSLVPPEVSVPRSRTVNYYTVQASGLGLLGSGVVVVLNPAVQDFLSEFTPTILRYSYARLDRRLPDRRQTPEGLATMLDFIRFASTSDVSPGLFPTDPLFHVNWTAWFPAAFFRVRPDLTELRSRIDSILTGFASHRHLTLDAVRRYIKYE